VLSIRRRQGPYEFRKESAFGDPDPGWPNWGELGPILLRSAGIVGVAGVIMVVAAGDTLFREPLRTPRGHSAALARPASSERQTEPIVVHAPAQDAVIAGVAPGVAEVAPADEAGSSSRIADVVAASPVSTEELASAKELVTAALRTDADETSSLSAVTEATADVPDAHPSAKELVATALRPSAEDASSSGVGGAAVPPKDVAGEVALDTKPDVDPVQLRLEPLIEIDPNGYAQSFSRGSAGDAEPRLVRARDIDLDGMSADIAMPAAEEDESGLRPEEKAVDVASLSGQPAEEDVARGTHGQSSGDEALWDDEAVECPRSWLEVSEDGGGAPADCEAKLVLVVPAETEETETGGDVTLDEALESAAASHALELAGFVARVPIPRPDNPPPVRRIRTGHRADWPAEPPPDCGNLHARWRFVDRKAGTKEWYCR
jgi:hypothetical protein